MWPAALQPLGSVIERGRGEKGRRYDGVERGASTAEGVRGNGGGESVEVQWGGARPQWMETLYPCVKVCSCT